MDVKIHASTLLDESILNTPASVTVVTRKQIKKLNIRKLSELLNFIPGYQSYHSDEGSLRNTYSIRGRKTGSGNKDVLLLIDGIKLNTWLSGTSDPYIANIDISSIEKIEFIRGPGSSIYGSGAFLGVINVVTDYRKSNVEFRKGSSTNFYGNGSYSKQWGSTSLSIKGMIEDSRGESQTQYNYLTDKFNLTREPMHQYSLQAEAKYRDIILRLTNYRYEQNDYYITSLPPDPIQRREGRSSQGILLYTPKLSSHFDLDTSVSYANYQQNFLIRSSAVSTASTTINEAVLNSKAILKWKKDETSLIAGVEYNRSELTDPKVLFHSVGTTKIELAPTDHRANAGVFTQFSQDFEKWYYNFGLRYDHYSIFGGHLNPRFGVIYKATPTSRLKFQYAESFRAPSVVERDLYSNTIYAPNKDIRSEVARTIEVIAQSNYSRKNLITLTHYSIRIDDAIVQTTSSPKKRYNNGRLNGNGIELEQSHNFGSGIGMKNAFSWAYDPIQTASSESAILLNSNISYTHRAMSYILTGNYQGKRMINQNDRNIHFGGATLFRLTANYNVTDQLKAFLIGNNIFDKKVLYPGSNASNDIGVVDAGRTVEFGLDYKF